MERLDHGVDFVQIGNVAIRLDNIAWVSFLGPIEPTEWGAQPTPAWVSIRFIMADGEHQNEARLELCGGDAILFKEWWDAHANVWVID